MNRQSLLGIALLLFPLSLLSGNQVASGPLIRSVSFHTGYDFISKNDPVRTYRPEADMSHRYFIPETGRVGVSLDLAPLEKLSITITGSLSSLKAVETFYLNYLEPLEYEVPFEELSGMAHVELELTDQWKLMAGGALFSGIQPRMVWMERDLGGDYVAEARPYQDGLVYLGAAGIWDHLAIEAVAGAARFHGSAAYQANISGSWIPFASGNTRINSRITFLADTLNEKGRILWGISLEQHLAGKIWFQASGSWGRMQNWWDLNEQVFMNMYDPVTSAWYAGFQIRNLTRNLGFSAGYGITARETTWDLYQYGEALGTDMQKSRSGLIKAGLVWKF
jgi:hypothetical protein